MARHYYTLEQRECKISLTVWCERARGRTFRLHCVGEVLAAALFYYSFLYLICRRCCCFSVLFHRRDEVYFETKTIFFSRDFARADTTDYCRALFLCGRPKLCYSCCQIKQKAPLLLSLGSFWLRLGPRADYGIFQCAAGRTRCFKQLCFKPPFISSFCSLSRAALSPHH